jgi:Vitamin K epoxide reductase family
MKLTDLTPQELSIDLREGSSVFLGHRRGILGLSLFSAAVMGGIALYQTGIVKDLAEPPWPRFDGEMVHSSATAYSHLGMPDALLGLTSYAITACLAGAGGHRRWKTHPWLPLCMATKSVLDASMAGKLTADQWRKYRAFSFWSSLSAGATVAALILAVPEAREALPQATASRSHSS